MNKCVMAILLSLSVSGVAAQQGDEATLAAVTEYTKAQEALKNGQVDAAIQSFEKAVSLNPELFLSHYYLGAAYQSKKNNAKTLEHFQKFLQRAGADSGGAPVVAANRGCGVALYKSKQVAKAVPYLKRAVKGNAKDVEVQLYLGMALRTTDEAAAEGHFAKVIELNPKAAVAYYYAGRIAFKRGNTQAASQRLEGYVALKSSGARAAQAHYMLASLASQAGDNDKAAEHYEKCIASDPQGSQAEKAKELLAQVKGGAPSS